MTEREYVETIRKAAEEYVTFIKAYEEGAMHAAGEYMRWAATRQSLSPHTAIELCDAWLERASDDRTVIPESE